MTDNTRTVQVRLAGEWVDTHPLKVLKGDLFRMFEPDKTPVRFSNGGTTAVASKNGYENSEGVYTVEYDD